MNYNNILNENKLTLSKIPSPRSINYAISGNKNIKSIFAQSGEKILIPNNIQYHLNKNCKNKKNKHKIQISSSNINLIIL